VSQEQEVTKTCTKCNKQKPLNSFLKRSGKREGQYFAECKACTELRRSAWAQNNREKQRAQGKRAREKLKQDPVRYARHKEKQQSYQRQRQPYTPTKRLKVYGLTHEAYIAMLERQGNACALCGKPETAKDRNGRIRALAIDHDHTTGEVRGLLCFRCNTSLSIVENGSIADIQAYLK
jgi:hypothetical protein